MWKQTQNYNLKLEQVVPLLTFFAPLPTPPTLIWFLVLELLSFIAPWTQFQQTPFQGDLLAHWLGNSSRSEEGSLMQLCNPSASSGPGTQSWLMIC